MFKSVSGSETHRILYLTVVIKMACRMLPSDWSPRSPVEENLPCVGSPTALLRRDFVPFSDR